MTNDTILQIPINKSFLKTVKSKAVKLGFSSLQDYTRFHYTQFVNCEVTVKIEPKSIKLSAKNAKRYDKMTDEVLSGKVKLRSANSINELMKQLSE